MATHSSILAWEIPWKDPDGYTPWGRKVSDTTEQLSEQCMCVCVCVCVWLGASENKKWK